MMRRFLLPFLLMVISVRASAQPADSLLIAWKDTTLSDSLRTDAYERFVKGSVLFASPDSAIVLADALLAFGDERHLPYAKAVGHNLKGSADWIKGDYPSALDEFRQSLAMAEQIGAQQRIANALNNIGNIHRVQGNLSEAEDYFQRSLAILEKLGDQRGIASCLNNMGLVQQGRNEPSKAIGFFERSLAIHEQRQDPQGMATALSNIGGSYMMLGEHRKALPYFERSLGLITATGDRHGLANTLANIGLVHQLDGDHRGAIDNCLKALAIAEEADITDQKLDACRCLYPSYQALGMWKEAFLYHQKFKEAGDALNEVGTAKKLQLMEFEKQQLADSLSFAADLAVQQQEVQKQKLMRNGFIGGFALVGLFAVIFLFQRNRISKARKRSDELLLNILPEEVADELKLKGEAEAKQFDTATILFTDFKGFTQASEKMSPRELVEELNTCFKAFDGIITTRGIEKIKTIGDAYMCAGGLPEPKSSSPADVVHAALEMQAFMKQRKTERDAQGLPAFEMRVGIHTGPVVAGIVGVKKFQYDIWGDTVNTASRMESSGEVGQVNISEATYALVKNEIGLTFTSRGKVQAKGKGEMEMYFVRVDSQIP